MRFAFTVWTLTGRLPLGILSFDSRTALADHPRAPGVNSCGLGQTMSGVIVAMRRTLLSCTSLARNGLVVLGATLVSIAPARADELALLDAISFFFDFNHQEIAVLTTALALLG